MSKRVALVAFTYQELLDVLRLPPGTVLTGVRDEIVRERVLLRVEHPDLELVEDGMTIPCVHLVEQPTEGKSTIVKWRQ